MNNIVTEQGQESRNEDSNFLMLEQTDVEMERNTNTDS